MVRGKGKVVADERQERDSETRQGNESRFAVDLYSSVLACELEEEEEEEI